MGGTVRNSEEMGLITSTGPCFLEVDHLEDFYHTEKLTIWKRVGHLEEWTIWKIFTIRGEGKGHISSQ